jgi:hypothetical protein
MRGTLHLLPTAELGTWLSAFGTYRHYGSGTPEIEAIADAVAAVLPGRVLTREELASEVERRTGSALLGEWVRESWGTSLKAISFRGLICFAPSDDGRVRLTAPATWVPGTTERVAPETALQEVTRRFLFAYGPSTAAHFGLWWGGTAPTRARRLLEALGEEARSSWTGSACGWPRTTSQAFASCDRRAARVSCRPSTPGWSERRGRPTRSSTPGTARASTAPRAGCRPSSWSAAASPACGGTQ